jgi:hypothetical protein
MSDYDLIMAYAGFVGTILTAAERAATLTELQDAIKAALVDVRAITEPAGADR